MLNNKFKNLRTDWFCQSVILVIKHGWQRYCFLYKKLQSPYKKLFHTFPSNLTPGSAEKRRKHPVYFTAKIDVDDIQVYFALYWFLIYSWVKSLEIISSLFFFLIVLSDYVILFYVVMFDFFCFVLETTIISELFSDWFIPPL